MLVGRKHIGNKKYKTQYDSKDAPEPPLEHEVGKFGVLNDQDACDNDERENIKINLMHRVVDVSREAEKQS